MTKDKWYTNNNQIRTRDNSRKIPISMATDRSHYVTIPSLPHVLLTRNLARLVHRRQKKKKVNHRFTGILIQQSLADGSSASRGFQVSTFFHFHLLRTTAYLFFMHPQPLLCGQTGPRQRSFWDTATSRKVAGWYPMGSFEIFHCLHPSGSTMTLSRLNLEHNEYHASPMGGGVVTRRRADNLATFTRRLSENPGPLNFLEPSEPIHSDS